jgi:hypothetical protein
MTIGFLLVFFGAQLYAVKSFQLSPKVAKFVKDRMGELNDAAETAPANRPPSIFPTGFNSSLPSTATGLAAAPVIQPPSWLRWAFLFSGVVLVLHGATLSKS